ASRNSTTRDRSYRVPSRSAHMSCASFETAPTKSAAFSSAGELLAGPPVPVVEGDCESLLSREKKFAPVAQLSNRSTTKPPRPMGPAPPPNPDRPRMSSISPRSPVHLMLTAASKVRADVRTSYTRGPDHVARDWQ